MDGTDRNRYEKAPIKRFVDCYVLDVIGALPPESSVAIQQYGLQRIFNTSASEWRQALRETLDLSETFDIAVLDLWHRWIDAMAANGEGISPEYFAAEFTDNYFADGSRIDVWPPGALDEAKARIAAAAARH